MLFSIQVMQLFRNSNSFLQIKNIHQYKKIPHISSPICINDGRQVLQYPEVCKRMKSLKLEVTEFFDQQKSSLELNLKKLAQDLSKHLRTEKVIKDLVLQYPIVHKICHAICYNLYTLILKDWIF
jgi:hypothetical protein